MGRKRLVVKNRLMHHSIVFQIRRFRFLAQCSEPCPSLFRMEITASITKSSRQDHIQGYLHLAIFFLIHTFLYSAGKFKKLLRSLISSAN